MMNAKAWKAVAGALCRDDANFKIWLAETLRDLSGYARDEGMLTDFGQGIRAAASRIQNRLLAAEEAVDTLAEIYRANFRADHENFAAADKKKDTENGRNNRNRHNGI